MSKDKFMNSNDRLFMGVKPFSGKYAVKTPLFFEEIYSIQKEKMDESWTYRPLNSEIEITNACNQSCAHCGMAANKMTSCEQYSSEELCSFIKQLHENGIVSFSITGGEPFIRFEQMLAMIKEANGKVDVCKITTNGFWGNKAESYFRQMENAGLLNNRFFVPCLMVSIGEQTTPMEDTCRIINYALTHYTKEQLTLCISSLSEFGDKDKINSFIETYEQKFGEMPQDRLFLTENFYRNSAEIRNKAKSVGGRSVGTYMRGPVRCFEPTIGKYVLPRMLVKANGKVCTCACFNPPSDLYIGNIKESSIKDVLNQINLNPIVKIITEDGLHNFRHWIDIEECDKEVCNNECEACKYLVSKFKKLWIK